MLTRNQPVVESMNLGFVRKFVKQLSPLAQSVSNTASKTNSTIFRTSILSRDNFMFPKSERHMATVTQCTVCARSSLSPWRIKLEDTGGGKNFFQGICNFEFLKRIHAFIIYRSRNIMVNTSDINIVHNNILWLVKSFFLLFLYLTSAVPKLDSRDLV